MKPCELPGWRSLIDDSKKDPLGAMLLDYLNGDVNAFVQVNSDTLEMWKMTGEVMFRKFSRMSRLEKKALVLCKGKILDVGAGSGCHAIYLQKRHTGVDALDISPGCIEVMKKRRIKSPIHQNFFSLKKKNYNTILMLMNGIGICGSLDGLNLFFQFIPGILSPNGQILVDSTDLTDLYDLNSAHFKTDQYYGETQFTMTYKNRVSDPFDWLYVDFDRLQQMADFHNFECEKILTDASHRYLARLTLR